MKPGTGGLAGPLFLLWLYPAQNEACEDLKHSHVFEPRFVFEPQCFLYFALRNRRPHWATQELLLKPVLFRGVAETLLRLMQPVAPHFFEGLTGGPRTLHTLYFPPAACHNSSISFVVRGERAAAGALRGGPRGSPRSRPENCPDAFPNFVGR